MTIAPPEPAGLESRSGLLPGSIRSALRGVDRRLRLAGMMRGLGLTLAVSAAISASAMAVDLLLPLPDPARWAVWLAWVGASAAVLVLLVVRPLIRRHRPDELAAVASRGEEGDRGQILTAAVALAGFGDRAHGSPELIAALVDRAAREAGGIDPRRAVPLSKPARRLALGLLAAGLVILPAVVSPDPFAALASRFLAPWLDPGSAGLLAIAVEPGDAVVSRGDPITISATVRARSSLAGPLPDSALLQWTDPVGTSHTLEMGPGAPVEIEAIGREPADAPIRTFAMTLPSVDGTTSYRVSAGSARSRLHRIEAVDPPRISSHRWTITPPGYTAREPETLDDPSEATAWQDSRISIVCSTDLPAHLVSLEWPDEGGPGSSGAGRTVPFEPLDADGRTWAVEVSATASGPFRVVAEDEHGLIGLPGRSGRLRVIADAPPVVVLADRDGSAEPGDRLSLPVASRDDVAVASADLHLSIVRAKAGADSPPEPVGEPIPLALDGLGTASAKGVAELDLAPLDLADGDALSVRVRVLDNLPPPRGPNRAWSEPMPVAIVADVHRFDADRLDEQLLPVREELEALARQAAENRRRLPPIRAAAEAARRLDDAWTDQRADDLDRLAESARELVDRLQLLARDLEHDPTLGPLADPVRQAAEAEADDARDSLDEARRLDDDPDARLDELRSAEAQLDAASKRLDDLKRQLTRLARAAAARPELADLAGLEDELAEQAEALAEQAEAAANPEAGNAPTDADEASPPIDPEALRQLREAQEQLSRALADLMRRAPALRDDADAESARVDAESARQALQDAGNPSDSDSDSGSGDPSRSASSARSAAEAMRRAAEELRRASGSADPSSRAEQLARLLADQASSPSPSSASAEGDPTAAPSGSTPAGPSDPGLDLRLRADHSWGDLPGHLRTELLRSSPDRYRPDYSAIIRLYFREIARGASDPDPDPDPGTPRSPRAAGDDE